MKLKEIGNKLIKLKSEIKEKYKAEVVSIFGSYVRGGHKKASDIDILVRFDKSATLFDFVGLANFLEEKLGIRIDVVSERAIRPELRGRILAEVVRL